MALPYDEQIKVWAAEKYNIPLDEITSVSMVSEFNEGYDCCGGRDPDCYCSLAESASMYLRVMVNRINNPAKVDLIDMRFGDINKMIQEIFEAS